MDENRQAACQGKARAHYYANDLSQVMAYALDDAALEMGGEW